MWELPHWQSEIRISTGRVNPARFRGRFEYPQSASDTTSASWIPYWKLPRSLRRKADPPADPVPPQRTSGDVNQTVYDFEYLQVPNYIIENVGDDPDVPVEASTLDTLYEVKGQGVPPPNENLHNVVMTYYHGPAVPQGMVFSGFNLWSFKRSGLSCARRLRIPGIVAPESERGAAADARRRGSLARHRTRGARDGADARPERRAAVGRSCQRAGAGDAPRRPRGSLGGTRGRPRESVAVTLRLAARDRALGETAHLLARALRGLLLLAAERPLLPAQLSLLLAERLLLLAERLLLPAQPLDLALDLVALVLVPAVHREHHQPRGEPRLLAAEPGLLRSDLGLLGAEPALIAPRRPCSLPSFFIGSTISWARSMIASSRTMYSSSSIENHSSDWSDSSRSFFRFFQS